jgi:hypothetical protein
MISGPAPGAYVQPTAGQSPANGVNTTLHLDAPTSAPPFTYDRGGFYNGANGLVVPAGLAGYYDVTGAVIWAGNAAGVRSLDIGPGDAKLPAIAGNTVTVAVTQIGVYAGVGQTFALFVRQTSGGALAVVDGWLSVQFREPAL